MTSPPPVKERLLDAAAEILESRGLRHLNTNALAAQAGVTPPTVYRYFENKEAVVVALAQRFIEAERGWLADAEPELQRSADAGDAACGIIDLYWNAAREQRGIVALRGAMRVWPELRAVEETSLQHSTEKVAALLQTYLPGHSRAEAWRVSRYIVELVCSTIDRCYPLPAADQAWRIGELKRAVVAYLNAHRQSPSTDVP